MIGLLVVLVICFAGYKVKTEWADTFKERQTASFWLFLVQRGEFDRAMLLVDEKECRSNGFQDFDIIKEYYEAGYFARAAVSKMYLDDRGNPVALVELPENPEFDELHLQVVNTGDTFEIREIDFTSGNSNIIDKLLSCF